MKLEHLKAVESLSQQLAGLRAQLENVNKGAPFNVTYTDEYNINRTIHRNGTTDSAIRALLRADLEGRIAGIVADLKTRYNVEA